MKKSKALLYITGHYANDWSRQYYRSDVYHKMNHTEKDLFETLNNTLPTIGSKIQKRDHLKQISPIRNQFRPPWEIEMDNELNKSQGNPFAYFFNYAIDVVKADGTPDQYIVYVRIGHGLSPTKGSTKTV